MKKYFASAIVALTLGGAAFALPASAAPVAPASVVAPAAEAQTSGLDLVQHHRHDRWERRHHRRMDRHHRRMDRRWHRHRDCRVRSVVRYHRGERIVRRIRTCR